MSSLGAVLIRHWFIVALVAVVIAAWLEPNAVSANGTVPLGQAKHALVAIIFFLTGAILPVRSLLKAAGQWQLHGLIQGLSLGLTPLLMWLALDPLTTLVGYELAIGLVILSALPTTISSCVVLTQEANGNIAAAVLNASLGNLLGIFITPLWISLTLGVNAELDPVPVIRNLGLVVVLPLALGLLLRIRWAQRLDTMGKRVSILSNIALLMIIWPGLADGFANRGTLPAWDAIALTGIIAIGLHLLLLGGTALIGLRMSRDNRICLMLCGSQKTLALGIPLLALLFANDPRLPAFSLALLIYHPAQLLIDAALAPRLRAQ